MSWNFEVFAVFTQADAMYDHKLSPHHVDKSCLWTQQISLPPDMKFIGFVFNLIWKRYPQNSGIVLWRVLTLVEWCDVDMLQHIGVMRYQDGAFKFLRLNRF